MKKWHLYIVECKDKTLYTGITTDIERRIQQHNTGKGAKSIVKSKRPVKLRYQETFENRSQASKREYQIKQLKRQEKLTLLEKGL